MSIKQDTEPKYIDMTPSHYGYENMLRMFDESIERWFDIYKSTRVKSKQREAIDSVKKLAVSVHELEVFFTIHAKGDGDICIACHKGWYD